MYIFLVVFDKQVRVAMFHPLFKKNEYFFKKLESQKYDIGSQNWKGDSISNF